MLTIIFRTLKDRLVTILAYSISSFLFLWMYIALFPYIQAQSESLSKLIEGYPKGLMEAFGFTSLQEQFAHLGSYLSTETFTFMFPILLIALVVGFGTSVLAGEIERGTIELALSQSISRLQVYLAKYLAAVLSLGFFVVISVFSIALLAAAYHIQFEWSSLERFWLVAFLFGLAILSVTFLISSVSSDKGRPTFVVTGVILVMYVLNVIAGLKPSLANMKYFSFFHYYDPTATLGNGIAIDSHVILVFLGVSIFATFFGALAFIRRDL